MVFSSAAAASSTPTRFARSPISSSVPVPSRSKFSGLTWCVAAALYLRVSARASSLSFCAWALAAAMRSCSDSCPCLMVSSY
jgi:hypothetical protein